MGEAGIPPPGFLAACRLPLGSREAIAPTLSSAREIHEWWKQICTPRRRSCGTPRTFRRLRSWPAPRSILGRQDWARSKIRLRSNAFGLTPAGRQQLRWLIGEEEEAPDRLPEERWPLKTSPTGRYEPTLDLVSRPVTWKDLGGKVVDRVKIPVKRKAKEANKR